MPSPSNNALTGRNSFGGRINVGGVSSAFGSRSASPQPFVFAAVSSDPEPDLDAARSLLRREAWATLDALIRQRGIDTEGVA